jgi:hypothetical protein
MRHSGDLSGIPAIPAGGRFEGRSALDELFDEVVALA